MAGDPNPAPSTLLRRAISLDTSLSLRLHTLCLPIPRSLLKALEISGDGRFWFPIPIALLYFYYQPFSPLLLPLLLGSLLDLLLVGLIKTLVRRPRPVYNKGMTLVVSVDHWSFPSGHSSRVSFLAAFLYLHSSSPLFLEASKRVLVRCGGGGGGGEAGDLLVHAVTLWAAATSASRVLLGRHFLLDVLAGACLGVVEALLVYHFLKF
ncbi:uncharacterized protein M6B38_279665 [Iris pallida]|uniref:Phosphatidic acid phosphatase type 2/haloperoxidase domain-containing protein n=1 Tax=Iris pallida TaxID=29817 RepID=A0AAX6HZE5_IRIPA|nr:uncharacterized protein M6B38_279665 [Iris pallida]